MLVIGPMRGVGGMATSMRLQLGSRLGEHYQLMALDCSKQTPPGRPLVQGVWSQLGKTLRLQQLLRRHRPQVVHIHTCSGTTFYRSVIDLWIARRYGARTLLHVRGGQFLEFLKGATRLGRWFARQGLLKADRVITLSACWEQRLRGFEPRIRSFVLHNGVNLPEAVADPRQGPRPTVLFVGALRKAKGVDDLIEAVAALPRRQRDGVQVRLVGPDPDGRASAIQTLIRRRGLQQTVTVVGPLPAAEVGQELAAAALFALPSHAEGLPNALLEAMAYGLPVVVTAAGAIPEVVEHGREGLVVAIGDRAALSDSLARLLQDPDLRAAMGQAARRKVRRCFRQEVTVRRLDGLYRMLLDGGRP